MEGGPELALRTLATVMGIYTKLGGDDNQLRVSEIAQAVVEVPSGDLLVQLIENGVAGCEWRDAWLAVLVGAGMPVLLRLVTAIGSRMSVLADQESAEANALVSTLLRCCCSCTSLLPLLLLPYTAPAPAPPVHYCCSSSCTLLLLLL